MKDLLAAMAEEKQYAQDRIHGIDTVLIDRLAPYGYTTLDEYFADKKAYAFAQWIPEVYPIDVCDITVGLEQAVREEKYGIYISQSNGLYAFHGSDAIDLDLCAQLGICVAELYYNGGTIIGSSDDLGIEIVAPTWVELTGATIMDKFYEIISRFVENVTIAGNDILVDGKKVMGSMSRTVGKAFVWAAQVSFADHSAIIERVCNKKSDKQPGYIDSTYLSKRMLESEVIAWLQKR